MEIKILNELFNEIIGWHKDISPDMALDCSTRIFNANNISEKKSNQQPKIDRKDDVDQPRASEKQQNYLYGLGYDGDASKLSIQEAKHLIEALKKKKD